MVLHSPSVFLIDPVSHAIKKKQYIHRVYQGPGFLDSCKIMAMKDRVFFICEGVTGMQITAVAGSGQGQVIGRFHANPPEVR